MFAQLGFKPQGRHWTKGGLFVEVPSHSLEGPAEAVHVGNFVFRISTKEALLVQRLAGFKHWQYLSYAQQAIDMIAAFGDDLNQNVLHDLLKREDVVDAFKALRMLSDSDVPVTEHSLQQLLTELRA